MPTREDKVVEVRFLSTTACSIALFDYAKLYPCPV
jgi:hypothetical protein